MPTRTPSRTRVAPADKREAILTAALHLFTERTFAACPVPLVAERAGVATGTIYRYFPSKEALVNELYRRWKGELQRVVVGGVPDDADAREQFHAWWDGLSSFARSHPTAFAFLEMHHHEPYLDDQSRALALAVDAAAVATVEEGQREGSLRAGSPALLVALVFGAFSGVVRAMQTYGPLLPDDAFEAAEGPAWDLLRAPTPGEPT